MTARGTAAGAVESMEGGVLPTEAHWTGTRVTVPTGRVHGPDRALSVAGALAERLALPLDVTSVVFDQAFAADRQASLAQQLGVLVPRSVRADVRVVPGTDPAQHIVDASAQDGAVVVMAAGDVWTALPGSVTADVMRFALSPVLMVGPSVRDWAVGPFGTGTIVVALDGSRLAEAAIPPARAWADRLGYGISLVEVVPRRDELAVARAHGDLPEGGTLVRASHHPALRGAEVSWEVLHGEHPHHVLCHHMARLHGGLLVMTTHGDTRTDSLIGSTTLHTVHGAAVPVLVVRP